MFNENTNSLEKSYHLNYEKITLNLRYNVDNNFAKYLKNIKLCYIIVSATIYWLKYMMTRYKLIMFEIYYLQLYHS